MGKHRAENYICNIQCLVASSFLEFLVTHPKMK